MSHISSGAPTYEVTVQPAETAFTLDELKNWLGIPLANTSFDDVLNEIIPAVTKNAERYTKRDFIAKTYQTFRDGFFDLMLGGGYATSIALFNNLNAFQLRRTPTTSIVSVEYLNTSNVLTPVDSSVYYFTKTNGSDLSLLLPNPGEFWPSDVLQGRLQSVTLTFIAGWADEAEFKDRWPDLWTALLMHAAYVFSNRGDCTVADGCQCTAAPAEARVIYDQYIIPDFAVC